MTSFLRRNGYIYVYVRPILMKMYSALSRPTDLSQRWYCMITSAHLAYRSVFRHRVKSPPPPPLTGPQRSPRANRPSRCHQNRIRQPDAGWLFAVDSRDRGCQPRGRGVGEGTGGRRTGNRLLGRLGSRCDPAISRRRCRKP